MRAAAIVPLCALLLLIGCGEETSTVIPEGAEKTVVNVVSEQTEFRPTDVSCSSGVEAEVGRKFDCHSPDPRAPTSPI